MGILLVAADAHETLGAHRLMLTLAALCGMLLMPLMFNAAFYRILRERFYYDSATAWFECD